MIRIIARSWRSLQFDSTHGVYTISHTFFFHLYLVFTFKKKLKFKKCAIEFGFISGYLFSSYQIMAKNINNTKLTFFMIVSDLFFIIIWHLPVLFWIEHVGSLTDYDVMETNVFCFKRTHGFIVCSLHEYWTNWLLFNFGWDLSRFVCSSMCFQSHVICLLSSDCLLSKHTHFSFIFAHNGVTLRRWEMLVVLLKAYLKIRQK